MINIFNDRRPSGDVETTDFNHPTTRYWQLLFQKYAVLWNIPHTSSVLGSTWHFANVNIRKGCYVIFILFASMWVMLQLQDQGKDTEGSIYLGQTVVDPEGIHRHCWELRLGLSSGTASVYLYQARANWTVQKTRFGLIGILPQEELSENGLNLCSPQNT